MPRNAQVFDVLIASPSDVTTERDAIEQVVLLWNAVHSRAMGIVLLPVRWETHTHPAFGDRPQAIINDQIVDNADIVIAVFWTRLGTNTGKAPSGTAEEIDRCRAAGKKVLTYFFEKQVPPRIGNTKQYRLLAKYQEEVAKQGLYGTFESTEQLRESVMQHLSAVVHELAPKQAPTLIPLAATSNLAVQRAAIVRGLRQRVLSIEAKWEAERMIPLRQFDQGKQLMRSLSDMLAQTIASPVVQADASIVMRIKRTLASAREIETYSITYDNTEAFWHDGEEVIRNIKALLDDLEKGNG